MPIFNGETLVVTLDSGVISVDVRDDLYEKWKDWLLESPLNRKYPQLFRVVGGDPLSSIINAGSYFFIQNSSGWRIRPPEENITVYLTGNLVPENIALPTLIPTIGTFTAAILGLQPVTQGVTPVMGDQLAFSSFQGAVCIDEVGGYPGTGSIGSDEIGTRKAPSDNPTDTLAIAIREGLTRIDMASSVNVTTADDFSAGYRFAGDRPQLILNLSSAPDMTNCSMTNLTLTGDVDGVNTIRDSSIGNVIDMSGFVEKTAFWDDVTLAGDLYIFESYSQKTGDSYMVFNTGAHEFQVSDWHRSMGITNMTAGTHTIEMYGGTLHLDALCTGGTIYLRGDYSCCPDDQSNGTILIDQTSAKVRNEIHGQMQRSIFINTELTAPNNNGFQQSPYDNWTDAVDDAEDNGLLNLMPMADATIDRQLKNFTIEGIGLPAIDLNDQIMDGTIFRLVQLTGGYSGWLNAIECALNNVSGLNGVFFTVNAAGILTVGASGSVTIWNVTPAIPGTLWTLNMNTGSASKAGIHKSSGEVLVTNMDDAGDVLHYHSDSGTLTLDATCTNGEVEVSGDVLLIDNSGVGCVVTVASKTSEIFLEAIV